MNLNPTLNQAERFAQWAQLSKAIPANQDPDREEEREVLANYAVQREQETGEIAQQLEKMDKPNG